MANQVMSEEEFDLLDELYFVKSFDELLQSTAWQADKLIRVLETLKMKEWVRPVSLMDGEHVPEDFDIVSNPRKYYYLATKKGLLAHNGF